MWEYRARSVRVIDGDTLVVLADVGFSFRAEIYVRLLDVWAPETRELGGADATAALQAWLRATETGAEWPLVLRTQRTRDDASERRTFVRYVGTITNRQGESLNDLLRAHYEAQGWPQKPLGTI